MIPERNRALSSWVDCRHALGSMWPLIALATSVAMLLGAYIGSREKELYEAAAEVSIAVTPARAMDSWPSTAFRPSVFNELNRREASLRSGVLLLRVIDERELWNEWRLEGRIEALGLLRDRVRIGSAEGEGVYRIAVRSESPAQSAELANAIVEQFVDSEAQRARRDAEAHVRSFIEEIDSRRSRVDEIERKLVEAADESGEGYAVDPVMARDLRRRLVNESNIVRSLEAKHQSAVVALQQVSSGVEQTEEASAEKARPVHKRWHTAGWISAAGLVASTLFVLLFSAGRSPFTVLAKLSDEFGAEVAGAVPLPRLPILRLKRPSDSVIEPYRDLRTRIQRLPAGECSVLGIVPEQAGAEGAGVAANLSTVLADGGHAVLLIDSDMRDPRIHSLLDAAPHPGLADYLTGEMRIEETVIKTSHSNLWFMPSGPPLDDPGRFLGSKRMEDLFWEMKSRFDYIVMTTPPVQTHADAGVLGGYADHMLVVSSYSRHSLPRLRKAHYSLEHSGATVSGTIVAYSVDERAEPAPTRRPREEVPTRARSAHSAARS